jgi:hypothetical protein
MIFADCPDDVTAILPIAVSAIKTSRHGKLLETPFCCSMF